MRARRLALLIPLLPLAPLAAPAIDLRLGVDTGVEYDTNVLSTVEDPQDDVDGFVGPRLVATDDDGHFRWDLRYSPRYRRYADLHELNGWDQDAYGALRWVVSRRTTVSLADRYLDYNNFTQIFSQDLLPDGSIDTGFQLGRENFQQNTINASLEHALSERHLITLRLDRYDNRFEHTDTNVKTKSEVTAAEASYYYTLRKTDLVGASLSATRQTIENPQAFNTDYVNLSFLWKHTFTPTLLLDVSVGPTWAREDPTDTLEVARNQVQFPFRLRADGSAAPLHASTCPTLEDGTSFLASSCQAFAPGEASLPPALQAARVDLARQGALPGASTGWTYFATVSLEKHWELWHLVLRYTRDVSTATETVGTVRDNYSASLTWYPARRWSLSLFGYYETREAPAGRGFAYATVITPTTLVSSDGLFVVPDVATASAFRSIELKTDLLKARSYLASFYANYQWSERVQVYFAGTWTQDTLESPLAPSRSTDSFRTTLGVIYWLPTLQLPI